VALPRGDWIETWSGSRVRGGREVPESERPLVATLWGAPSLGHSVARLGDGTRINWRRGEWSVTPLREVELREVAVLEGV
jgi:hypothetical protein